MGARWIWEVYEKISANHSKKKKNDISYDKNKDTVKRVAGESISHASAEIWGNFAKKYDMRT